MFHSNRARPLRTPPQNTLKNKCLLKKNLYLRRLSRSRTIHLRILKSKSLRLKKTNLCLNRSSKPILSRFWKMKTSYPFKPSKTNNKSSKSLPRSRNNWTSKFLLNKCKLAQPNKCSTRS